MKLRASLDAIKMWYSWDRCNNLNDYLEHKPYWRQGIFQLLHHDFHQLNKGYGSKRYKLARKRNERKKKHPTTSKAKKARVAK